jgi:hypothetical protein
VSSTLDIPAFLKRSISRFDAGPGTGAHLASMRHAMAEGVKLSEPTVIYSGAPEFDGGEALLFDSSRGEDAGKLPESGTLGALQIRFPDGTPDHKTLDPELKLLIFVGDLASPRATVRLVDMVRRRGQRPLNVAKTKADIVRMILVDPNGAWRESTPMVEVALAW